MEVSKVIVGYLEENCYLIKIGNEALIVDPGDEVDKIIDMIGSIKVVGILITHAHFDHIGALKDLEEKLNVPIYYHNINNELNYEKLINVSEKEYRINNFDFDVIYTPGHRNDSVTYYFKKEKLMFTGDFIFKLSIGRTDLEYGSSVEMQKSIEKIKKYEDDIKLYPGHGENTMLGFEKMNNYFLKNIY